LAGIHLLWEIEHAEGGDPHAYWSSLIGEHGEQR